MIPSAPLDQCLLLMSGASSVKDREVRAVYLAAARALLGSHQEKAQSIAATLEAMEGELARSTPVQQELERGKGRT